MHLRWNQKHAPSHPLAPEGVSQAPLKVLRAGRQYSRRRVPEVPVQRHVYLGICPGAPEVSGGDLEGVVRDATQLQAGSQTALHQAIPDPGVKPLPVGDGAVKIGR